MKTLLEELKNKGHIVYIDHFYSSVNLYTDLEGMGFSACGTGSLNLKGLPQDKRGIKKKKVVLPDLCIDKK